jgi:hypothetical protein
MHASYIEERTFIAVISDVIVWQHDLKKCKMEPFGPRALLDGRESITSLISRSQPKGDSSFSSKMWVSLFYPKAIMV